MPLEAVISPLGGIDHLGLGQHLRRPEHARRRPARRSLLRDKLALGRGVGDVAQIAGHTSIRTTAMYVEANPTRLARILQDVSW
jgi:integrase